MVAKRKIYLSLMFVALIILGGITYWNKTGSPAEFYVLVYHNIVATGETSPSSTAVTQDVLEKEILYLLSKGYIIESLDTIMEKCENHQLSQQKYIALTFDDSWKGQYTYALPLLQKYTIPATFFIWSNVVGQKDRLSWEDIQQLDESGMVIGGHTLSHPDLSKLTSAQMEHEILDNKKLIETKLNKKIASFAYPFNSLPTEAVNIVKQSGYQYARTSVRGPNTCTANTYTLKSYVLDSFDTFKIWF